MERQALQDTERKAIMATTTQTPINLTHHQLMALGWSAQCKEYVQDGENTPAPFMRER